MSTKLRHAPRGLLALLLALLAVQAASACTDGEGPEAPLSSPSPRAPTATPAPADPDLGRFYHRNGQYEEAAAVFQSVVTRTPDPTRQQARLSLALTYLDWGRDEEALAELDAYLASAGAGSPDALRARFLRARALTALARHAEALYEYPAYLHGGGPAADYAHLGSAAALALLGRPVDAAAEAEAALAADLPPATRARALLLVAQSLEQAGDVAGADVWYGRLAQTSDSPADQALARWHQADLARQAGDPSWAARARQVLADYPSTGAAILALDALQEADERVDGYRAGVALYRHFRDDEALAALESNLDSPAPSHKAETYYYLAVARERLGDEDGALQAYQQSLQEDPRGPLADDAAWWRARLLEATGRPDEAAPAYAQFLLRYSGSSWAPDARFRRGLVLYKESRFAEAAEAWRSTLTARQSPEDQGRVLLWLAKAETKLGNDAPAQRYLRQLASTPEAGYFSLRAATLLSGEDEDEVLVDITIPSTDWTAADAWAAALEPAAAPPSDPTSDPRWATAAQLLDLGLYDEAKAHLQALLDTAGSSPTRLYRIARAYDGAGHADLAARAATLFLEDLSPSDLQNAPPEVWRLAYPAAFASLVETAARRERVSPALLLALIRQESFFDPRAGSGAGALGLTQVIPSTGQDIADDLDEEGEFVPGDLLRPAVSIRFGTRYLKQQLQAFDGSIPEALAAYNGGPGNARRWSRASGGDPDLFLQEVDLPETQAYLRLVSENLARYEQLYRSP